MIMEVLRWRVVSDPPEPRLCVLTHKQHIEWTQYEYTKYMESYP